MSSQIHAWVTAIVKMRSIACCMQQNFAYDVILILGPACLMLVFSSSICNYFVLRHQYTGSSKCLSFILSFVQVLRILEGDMVVDSGSVSAPSSDSGSRSWRMLNEQQNCRDWSPARQDSHRVVEGKNSYDALRAAWDRNKQSVSHRY